VLEGTVLLTIQAVVRDNKEQIHHLEVHYQQLAEEAVEVKVLMELQVDLVAVPWVDLMPVLMLLHKVMQDLQQVMMVLVAVVLVALEHLQVDLEVGMPMVV
tara:strand:+ start:38 stop:340 length:303 start_codon:yes stop_codon:yes gene_type:complete